MKSRTVAWTVQSVAAQGLIIWQRWWVIAQHKMSTSMISAFILNAYQTNYRKHSVIVFVGVSVLHW